MDQLLAMRAFVRIVEAGSFARAADGLNLPRSSVSKLVQDLETHLGVRLVARTTRSATVTPEGAAYYDHAARLLLELEEIDAGARGAGGPPRGRLRVDIGSSLANLLLIPSLPDFRARYPEIDLSIGVSDRAVDLVGDGVDCVIRGGKLADSALMSRHLCDLDFVTCAGLAYFATRSTPRTPGDLKTGHQILTYFSALSGKPFPLRFGSGDAALELGGPGGVSVNESTGHLTALVAGLGIGQTFGFMARPHLAAGRLVEVLPDWRPPAYPLQLVYAQRRQPSARLRVFIDWAAETFAGVDGGPKPG